ncbi:MAG: methyltransferase domain-containing protein [Rhodospirillales bacterium]|nr:methyltransferase domain-containing protein [Rhodospirillales bacterium]
MSGPFDRRRVRAHRNRAAPGFPDHRFLYDLALDRLMDRLRDIRREFPCAALFGLSPDSARRAGLCAAGGIKTLIQVDLAEKRLDPGAGPCVQADAEFLPFADGVLDLALSVLDLHLVNDLPGALVQIRRALRPDGVFLAALWGGETLADLRRALVVAEMRLRGGAGPRVAPFADSATLAGLMQRAGFALPVVDSQKTVVEYADPMRVFADLKGMGESCALVDRPRGFAPKGLFPEAVRVLSGSGSAPEGISVSFEMVFLLGWGPHESQPRPLKPGSAAVSLVDVLE